MKLLKKLLSWFTLTIQEWREDIKEYSARCQTSGFVPADSPFVRFLVRQLSRLMVYIQLGRLRVIGKENLNLPGRFIFCPNHSSLFDAPVMYAVMRKAGLRYMTAFEEMRGWWGLKAILMGGAGCIPVDRTKGKSVIEPSVDVLVAGGSLTVFPEGRISVDGKCLPFKMGPAVITKAAYDKLGGTEVVGIIPVNITFHRRHNATATKGYAKMGLKWRGGVTVTISKPIYMHDVHNLKPEEVMALAHSFVCLMHAQAETRMPCRREKGGEDVA